MDKREYADAHGEKIGADVKNVITGRRERITVKRSIGALCWKILAILAILWALFSAAFGIGAVSGEGMYPRLRDGDLAVYYRLERERNVGDVVAYRTDGQLRYGRIVAMSGDTVDMDEDGQLLVNGSVQQEEIFFPTRKEGRAAALPVTLGEGEVFVLGDNREYAKDSRDFGPISNAQIKGKVISLLRSRGI
ncbi:MAG: signal peptidase I [Eubacteriales bacterium]|nr:signal peptidase I [Eubacteriales bacterium]